MAQPADFFRILLVEDTLDHAELIRRGLERSSEPVALEHVTDGEQALQRVQADPLPHLILLDLGLPGLDGLSVLQVLKSDPRTAATPVVVLSSSDADRDVRAAYARHANSYLVKPMSLQGFRTLLADLTRYWAQHNIRP